jgi:CDP-paratose 2-epimerase
LAIKKIDKISGEVYNIGGGPQFTMSLLELIGFLEDFLGKSIDLSYADWRPGDQPVYVSNPEKAHKEIGWQPRTGVEEGVRILAEWVRDNKSLFDWLK